MEQRSLPQHLLEDVHTNSLQPNEYLDSHLPHERTNTTDTRTLNKKETMLQFDSNTAIQS